MAKKSIAQKIREYLASHPTAAPAGVAEKFNVSPSYIYTLRSKLKQAEPVVQEKQNDAPKEVKDMVNRPPHYTEGGIEVIDYIEAKALDYHLGNVIKYVSRAGKKGDTLEDLKKARWYLDRAIEKRSV